MFKRHGSKVALACLLTVGNLAACKRAGEAPPAPRQERVVEPAGEAPAPPPDPREGWRTVRSAMDEAARLELSDHGAFVPLTGPAATRHTGGGWPASGAKARSVRAQVFDVEGGVREVVVRARSDVAGQKMSVYLGRQALMAQPVAKEWTELRFPVPKPAGPALRTLKVEFVKPGKPPGQLAWARLLTAAGLAGPPAPLVGSGAAGGDARRGVAGGPGRRISWYLQAPDAQRGALLFDVAADGGPAKVSVLVAADGDEPKKVWSGSAGGERWTPGSAELTPWAGRPVRIDLVTEEAGDKVIWSDPVVAVQGPSPAQSPAKTGAPRQPADNIVIIVIDTVRFDVFGPWNPKGRVPTPAYDSFADDATVFVNAYNNENWTKPSCATLLSGLYPSTHGTKSSKAKLPDDVEILPETLKRAGFSTGAFVANGYVSAYFGFDQGWDRLTNYIRQNKASHAAAVYEDALAWATKRKKAEERFLLYVQTIDPHVAYSVPKKWWRPFYKGAYKGKLGKVVDGYEVGRIKDGKQRVNDDDKAWMRALYDGEVAYHDHYMGRFFEGLKAAGITDDNTVFVITNDHGEEFFDHGLCGHGHSLYEEMVRAPLAIRFPRAFPPGRRVQSVVEHVDVMPTLLDMVGVRRPEGLEGVSLVDALKERRRFAPGYAVIEFLDGWRGVRVGPIKYMRSRSGKDRLFDLSTDPREQRELGDEASVALRLASIHLAEGLATPAKWARLRGGVAARRRKAVDAKLDGEIKRQLEALGYAN